MGVGGATTTFFGSSSSSVFGAGDAALGDGESSVSGGGSTNLGIGGGLKSSSVSGGGSLKTGMGGGAFGSSSTVGGGAGARLGVGANTTGSGALASSACTGEGAVADAGEVDVFEAAEVGGCGLVGRMLGFRILICSSRISRVSISVPTTESLLRLIRISIGAVLFRVGSFLSDSRFLRAMVGGMISLKCLRRSTKRTIVEW